MSRTEVSTELPVSVPLLIRCQHGAGLRGGLANLSHPAEFARERARACPGASAPSPTGRLGIRSWRASPVPASSVWIRNTIWGRARAGNVCWEGMLARPATSIRRVGVQRTNLRSFGRDPSMLCLPFDRPAPQRWRSLDRAQRVSCLPFYRAPNENFVLVCVITRRP
jgi:hypothetical protein